MDTEALTTTSVHYRASPGPPPPPPMPQVVLVAGSVHQLLSWSQNTVHPHTLQLMDLEIIMLSVSRQTKGHTLYNSVCVKCAGVNP